MESFNSYTPFEGAPFILISTFLAGIGLALLTDEHYLLLYTNETHHTSKDSALQYILLRTRIFFDSITPYYFFYNILVNKVLYALLTVKEGIKCAREYLKNKYITTLRKIVFAYKLCSLKRVAESRRHLLYLMFKYTFKVPIKKNEKEFDSYIDIKESMSHIWPFMWVVSNVKNSKITCCDMECIPMSSYSYLDLIRDSRVQDRAIASAKNWSTGNHGPRMLGGNMSILRDLEKIVAKFYSRDDALLCATGYLACMSAVAAIATKNTVIFADSRLHASLTAGLKIGLARVIWFKHNNFKMCSDLIRKYRSKYINAWIIVESVYSMDGDICNLPEAHALCQKHNINLIIDEAHGLGVLGKTGRGAEEYFNLPGVATLIVGTFSKSIASVGGFITGPSSYMKFMDFHAPGNVFSAPLTAYSAGAAIESFKIIDKEPWIIEKAQKNAKMLHAELSRKDYWPANYPEHDKFILQGNPDTTVIPIVFPNAVDRVMRIATSMKKKGFMCSAVAYPACPLKYPRFRLTSTTAYNPTLIKKFVKTFIETCVEEEPVQFSLGL